MTNNSDLRFSINDTVTVTRLNRDRIAYAIRIGLVEHPIDGVSQGPTRFFTYSDVLHIATIKALYDGRVKRSIVRELMGFRDNFNYGTGAILVENNIAGRVTQDTTGRLAELAAADPSQILYQWIDREGEWKAFHLPTIRAKVDELIEQHQIGANNGNNDGLGDLFSPSQINTLLGVTKRMLGRFQEHGIIQPAALFPHRLGTRRLYDFDDLIRLRVADRMQHLGYAIELIVSVVGTIRTDGSHADPIVVNEGTIKVAKSDDELVALTKSGFSLVISVDEIRDYIEGRLGLVGRERLGGGDD